MSQSFDINVLREEARTRWLKPSEVYYILQNHERFPITYEAPKQPPSGSLFLYNRRVNRYFRRDGHTWRRKKDGRTVGEAHERLKVGNVDALSCYYAHGEKNPCFQRRCFWMLEPAYEHIVLVQYREVAEGRYYSSQLFDGPPESLSSLGYPHAIYGNQYLSSTSGTSEGSESHQSYSNLSSVTEVSSYSGNKEYNKDGGSLLSIPELGQTCLEQTTEVYRVDNGNSKNKSGLNVALKKIDEQLSLGDDDDDYIYTNQVQPLGFATNTEPTDKKDGDQIKQIQPEGTEKGLGRNIAPYEKKNRKRKQPAPPAPGEAAPSSSSSAAAAAREEAAAAATGGDGSSGTAAAAAAAAPTTGQAGGSGGAAAPASTSSRV